MNNTSEYKSSKFQLLMKDLNKYINIYLYDDYDFVVANEIRLGNHAVLSEPIKLLQAIDNKLGTYNGFLDVGCNIGQFSLVAAAYGYKVFGIDGDARNIEQLSQSAILNSFPIKCCLGMIDSFSNENERQNFTGGACPNIFGIPFDSYNNSLETDVSVDKIILDKWWNDEGRPKIDVVKLDIEGAEFYALESMKEILSNQHPAIYIEYSYAYAPYNKHLFIDFREKFKELGYKPYLIKNADELYEITSEDNLGCKEFGNYLFIHNDSDLLNKKTILQHSVTSADEFCRYAIDCPEVRYQAGFALELINIYKTVKMDLLIEFRNSFAKKKTEQSNVPLTKEENILIDTILNKLNSIIGE